ncbi:MAG: FAD-dependent monooxygenase [Endozoicomonadaceae bacterium]|nr:FAD-dependent monooxygenase [Endozoicomonadaceae bacterium]
MNSRINIFSSSLLGCQRKALNTEEMTLKKPCDLLITIKDLIIAAIFRYYMVAIVDSENVFTNLGMIPERLELMSPRKTKEILKNYVITVQDGGLVKNNISFFKDAKGNIYQGECNKKDHTFHIKNMLSTPYTNMSSVDISHSNENNSNDNIASRNDITIDKTNQKEQTETPYVTKQTKTPYVTEQYSNAADHLPAIDTCNDTENTQEKEEKHLTFSEELKAFEIKLAKQRKEKERLKKTIEKEKKTENKQQEISISNTKKKVLTKTNQNFRNVFKKTPEVYEIAESKCLFKVVTNEIITELEKDFVANPAASLSNLRRALIYYYGSIIDNSNEENTKRLSNLVNNLQESLQKSNHSWAFELRQMEQTISEEIVHGYLIHNPDVLRNRLANYYKARNNPATSKEEHNEYHNVKLTIVFMRLEAFITDYNHKRSIVDSDSDYISDPSTRTYQWHYEFAELNKSCGGVGFSDIILLNSKDEILGKENWEEFKKLSEKMESFDASKFKIETQLLTEMMSKEVGQSAQFGLQYINKKIKQLESNNDKKELIQLSRLKNYKEKLMLIADAKHMFFCFEKRFCSQWDISILLNKKIWGHTDQDDRWYICFKKISDLGQLRHPIINEIQLYWMVNSHNNAASEKGLKVCIEGAGPAGLISALSQYKVGASVTLIEKRNTDYNRVQIVRLDPKTMSWLRFHMPQGYSELFPQTQEDIDAVSHTKFGLIKPDGFGLIAINELEDKLHKQLTKLSSLSIDKNGNEGLERFAMMEIIEVMVDDKGKSFCLTKQSPLELDKDTVELNKKDEEVTFHKIEFDILICAGGKTSTVGKHLNPVPVTNKKHYGVCTWDVDPTDDDEENEFDDFRNVLPLDKQLENKLNQQFNKQLSNEQQKLIFASEEPIINLRPKIRKVNTITIEVVDGRKKNKEHVTYEETTMGELLVNKIKITLKEQRSKVLQTRVFENNNRFYIGMEIPSGYDHWSEMVLENISSEQRKIAKQMLIKCWFQAVASFYGIDNYGAIADRINTQFSSRFPLQQYRVTKNPLQLGEGFIIAVGDASCAPHFMTASGITAVRAGVDNAETLTKSIVKASSNTTDESQKKLDIEISKRHYVFKQCRLEEEIINRSLHLIDNNNIEDENVIKNPETIKSKRSLQLKQDVSDDTKNKYNKDTLIKKYNVALNKIKHIQSALLAEKTKIEKEIESARHEKEEMQNFLLQRQCQFKDKLDNFMGSCSFNVSRTNTKTRTSSNIENAKFIRAINDAEIITDKVIKSWKTKYINAMQCNANCRIGNVKELPCFWNMKDNIDVKILQRSKLFNAIKRHVIDEQDRIIDKFNKSTKSLTDHSVAKRNLNAIKRLLNVFWPNRQYGKSFLVDVSTLESDNEFDEMSDILFNARWNMKGEKTSIVSLFKDENKLEYEYISRIDQMIEKTELFELSSLSEINSHELNKLLVYLDAVTEEAEKVEHKLHRISLGINTESKTPKPMIKHIAETVKKIESHRAMLLGGIKYGVGSISSSVPEPFNCEQLTEELNLLTSTIAHTVKKKTDDIISEQTNHLEKQLELKPEVCRELIRKQMFDTNLFDIKDKEDNQYSSTKFEQEVNTDVLEKLRLKSPFWNDHFTRMDKLYSKNKSLNNEDSIKEFKMVSDFCLMLIRFYLQVELGLDKQQVLIHEDANNFIQWNKNKKGRNANQFECVLVPAIVDHEQNIIIQGLGLIELGKKFNFSRNES